MDPARQEALLKLAQVVAAIGRLGDRLDLTQIFELIDDFWHNFQSAVILVIFKAPKSVFIKIN